MAGSSTFDRLLRGHNLAKHTRESALEKASPEMRARVKEFHKDEARRRARFDSLTKGARTGPAAEKE